MPIGSPTLPSSPGAVPGAPALPSPPVLPPIPPTGGGGSGSSQPRLPIITRYDYSPGATATGGFMANAPTSNLLIPRPQLTAIAPGGSVSFTVTLSAPALIGLIYFANLIADVSATVTVSAGAFSQTVGVYPSIPTALTTKSNSTASAARVSLSCPPPRWSARSTSRSPAASFRCRWDNGHLLDLAGPIGMAFGWGLTMKDLSAFDRVTFGSPYVTRRQMLRVLNMGFDFLVEGGVYANIADQVFEGASSPFQASVIAGQSRPIAAIPFPDDVDNLERKSVAGYVNTGQQFTNPLFATWNTTFSIEQM